jgi:hypothetical protein
MKKEDLKNLIKEAITDQFLKNSDLQQLNKIVFKLYDSGKIEKSEYASIQTILKKLDK